MIDLFSLTRKPLNRLLISIGITTVSFTHIIPGAQGTTIVRSQRNLNFTNFSHIPEEISRFQSAFAYVLSEDDFAIVQSDPQFVTGVPVLFNPLSPQFDAISTSIAGENLVTAPLQFDSVTGNVFGQNDLSYSEFLPDRLDSANLSSASTFSVDNTEHLISTVGQSGFNFSFLVQPEETLSFDFHSSSELQASTNLSRATNLEVTDQQVIYFYTQPANVEIDNGILMLSLYPQLHLSANDPRIEVGLLALNNTINSTETDSYTVNHNSSIQESSPYFNLSTSQNAGDNLRGTFEYTATEPTILTAVAYTSNSATSSDSARIPESATGLPLIYFSLIILGAKLISHRTKSE